MDQQEQTSSKIFESNNETYYFQTAFKKYKLEGNLAYEYNPLRNYRLTEDKFEYNNSLYTLDELYSKFGITYDDTGWYDSNDQNITGKVTLYPKGSLVDFDTDELNFDLSHPVDMLPLYSYDNSVNLILNDGKNTPRLINTRFSPIGRDKYKVVDRKGDNDTNIYDLGALFDIDTSLYKRYNNIPKLKYNGTIPSGNLSVGNYHFYFKYMDADGNESDFMLESGVVSVFIGNEPYNIHSGFGKQSSYKGVSFTLSKLDSGYLYISVYYTVGTSAILEHRVVSAYKIVLKYVINTANTCYIKISGFEDKMEIPLTDINLQYLIVNDAYTQATCQNMLFLGNVHKPDINYTELSDISLRIYPKIVKEDYNIKSIVDSDYKTKSNFNNSYYNSKFIYNKTGYWNREIYRFGVVYILNNGELSPVFNIRGIKDLIDDVTYSQLPFENDSGRLYISYNEETFKLQLTDSKNKPSADENAKGTVYMNSSYEGEEVHKIYSIKFEIGLKTTGEHDFITNKLSELGIRGLFFVRQLRIPTTLAQAYTIGVDKESHVPVIPVYKDRTTKYYVERFLDEDRKVTHDYDKRIEKLSQSNVIIGAICPEYDINYIDLNNVFRGDTFLILKDGLQSGVSGLYLDSSNTRHYTSSYIIGEDTDYYEKVKIQSIQDSQKLVAIEDNLYSARAGEAEEARLYEYIGHENKTESAYNLVRGCYGSYLALSDTTLRNCMINIRIPGYTVANLDEYFLIRYQDKSLFYAISDKYGISELDDDIQCYRGDCYICQFTHRLNRNFQDPSAPTNDKIVDEDTWVDNYEVEDGIVKSESFSKINLGDINAVKMGSWITLVVRSSKNLNIRAIDDSYPSEVALFGQGRGFFPHYAMSAAGAFKIPEAYCYNEGFEKSLSERWNYELPDVPYLKNEFSNRIIYSEPSVNDAFRNGFRIFRGTNYRDYSKEYGSITKLIDFKGSLICVFEHGVGLIPVNERTVAGSGDGGEVFINTKNVLPDNPYIISNAVGSQWRESIIKTDRAIYGVDTVAKKIWRTDGKSFDMISDFLVQEFLHNNITLTERETEPIIGIRNVKTHYNNFKNDVLFTFYDNLSGFTEKSWNLCWNEQLQKWITFYSWIPSYSENIYNQFFTFDRNTSKTISKLAYSSDSILSEGIYLVNNIITLSDIDNKSYTKFTNLKVNDTYLPSESGFELKYEYSLVLDPWNYKLYFEISGNELWLSSKDSSPLKEASPIYLDIKCEISKDYGDGKKLVSYTTIETRVALIYEDMLDELSTDFWRHGNAGIIDKKEVLKPTHWYGKQHPFEFEFVVDDLPQAHKIFDNLVIISNKAKPDSFHYEIVGECYDFCGDKKNMYIRQEATKLLYQDNGCDITYNDDYLDLTPSRKYIDEEPVDFDNLKSKHYAKSTLFPLYYARQDTINEIEDSYNLKESDLHHNFSALAGGEIVHYNKLNEYRIWNHAKAVDIRDKGGRLRGNMQYKEDRWFAQINPLNIVQRNEGEWKGEKHFPPIELNQSSIPKVVLEQDKVVNNTDCFITTWNWKENQMSEVKLKDKYIKVRIRYTGEDLAIIHSVMTLYSLSYS